MIEAQESITGTISSPTAINSVINNGVVIPTETDPTVPEHVKKITEEDINKWNNVPEIDTSNIYTKEEIDQKGYITEEQVDNKGYTTKEDIATYVEANKEALRGPQGEQGPKGDKGETGEAGPQGEQGPKGDKGDKADTPEFEKEINGTTLTINDGKKFKAFEIDGASYQETTSGKNLANINDNTNNVSSKWNFEVGNIEKDKNYSLYLNVDGYISMNLKYNTSSGSVIKAAYNLTGINVINFTATTDGVLFINCFNADSGVYNNIPEIMLVEGNYTKDNIGEYEPYTNGPTPNPDYPQEVEVVENFEVKVTGKNLFDKNDTSKMLIDHYCYAKETIKTSAGLKMAYIPCKPNTTYTVSKIVSARFSIGYTNEIPAKGVLVIGGITGNELSALVTKTSSDAKYLCVFYKHSSDTLTAEEIEATIQIEEGSKSTDYEPYRGTTTTIDLQGNFLAKIGDVYDELDVVSGKLTKRIGRTTLDGSETWTSSKSGNYYRFSMYHKDVLFDAELGRVANDFVVSHFVPSLTDGYGIFFQYKYQWYFYPQVGISTSDEWKNWLASNNVTIYYVLAEPYEVQLNLPTIPIEEGKENHYSISDSLVTDVYCKYYTPYRGDDGTTPVKGIDYFTREDKQELINSMPTSTVENIATLKPEEGESYVYFFPNIVSKGLVDGTYYLTHTLKLATNSVGNTTDTSNNTTLFTFDNLVEIKEYVDPNNKNIKLYSFTGLNNRVYDITTENGVITDVWTASPVLDAVLTDLVKEDFYTKAEVDNLLNSIQQLIVEHTQNN